jgi:hypothetical protein
MLGLLALVATATACSVTAAMETADGLKQRWENKINRPVHTIPLDTPRLRLLFNNQTNNSKDFAATLEIVNRSSQAQKLTLVRVIGFASESVPKQITIQANGSVSIPLKASIVNQLKNTYLSLGVIYGSSAGGMAILQQPIAVTRDQFTLLQPGNIKDRDKLIETKPTAVFESKEPEVLGGETTNNKDVFEDSAQSRAGVSDLSHSHISKPGATAPARSERQPVGVIAYNLLVKGLYSIARNVAESVIATAHAATLQGTHKGKVVFKSILNPDADLDYAVSNARIKVVPGSKDCGAFLPWDIIADNIFTEGNGNFNVPISSDASSYRICVMLENSKNKLRNADGTWTWQITYGAIPSERRTLRPQGHDGALDVWHEISHTTSRMNIDGINKPFVEVKFPSQAGDCSPSTQEEWSCAGPSGIKIASFHALSFGVVAHEYAHRYDQDNAGTPSYIPTQHSFTECSAIDGQIIVEGYANFEMARVLSGARNGGSKYSADYRPDIAGTMIYSINFENNPNLLAPCDRSNKSESVVSTVLWDFYDKDNVSDNQNDSDGVFMGGRSNDARVTKRYLQGGYGNAKDLFKAFKNFCSQTSSSLSRKCERIVTRNNGSF